MDIKIIDVTVTEVPKKFGTGNTEAMSVTFENLTFGGKTDGKKLQGWATNKAVWVGLANAKKGDIFSVTTEKNAKGYIDWTDIEAKDAVEVVQEVVAKTPRRTEKGAQVAGTWDIKNQLDRERFEHDKEKQVFIVRQSSLSTAVALLASNVTPIKGAKATPEDVIDVAEEFTNYVFNGLVPKGKAKAKALAERGMADMEDDFPN